MRILYMMSGEPSRTSGRLRHHFLLRELSKQHEVQLVMLVLGPAELDDLTAEERFPGARAEYERQRPRLLPRLLQAADRLGLPTPRSRRLAAESGRTEGARPAHDVAILAGANSFSLLRALHGRIPTISDLCDAHSIHLLGRLQYASAKERPRLRFKLMSAGRMEQATVRLADATLLATQRDVEAVVQDRPTDRVAVVPNGVDLAYWQRSSERLGDEIVFSGGMGYAPNADAAIQLVDVILPLVRQQLPDARLRIIGRDPPPALQERGRLPGVVVTGFVDDVRPHLEQGGVFAAPLRFGAGIQNKMLEALSMEVPCVTTHIVASAFQAEGGPGAPLDVVDDPAAFAEQLVMRLRAVRENPAPNSQGREFVSQHFSWPAAAARLESVMERVMSKRRK